VVAVLILHPARIDGRGKDALVTVDVPATETLDEESNACAMYPYLKFEKGLHSNLGGHGPDTGPEGIIYLTKMVGEAAGEDEGKEVELELHATGDYYPAAIDANGLQGQYGSVNIMASVLPSLLVNMARTRHGHRTVLVLLSILEGHDLALANPEELLRLWL